MNEFIEQFLLEARELVEQATADLLALEEDPSDRDRLDGAFRGFHTLKGAAGIVDFDAMARALHAGEDILSRVRAGEVAVTPSLISDNLTCLDQVVQWLDVMQVSGEPPADADRAANVLVERLNASSAVFTPPEPLEGGAADWAADLRRRHTERASQARVAVRYMPDTDCFFRGDDPVILMGALPGLLALELSPREPWPALESFDPFRCHLVFQALSSAPPETVERHLKARPNQLLVVPLDAPSDQTGAAGFSPEARGLLAAQILLLNEPAEDGAVGRLISAGRVAANVLRHMGKATDAELIERAMVRSQIAGDPRPLVLAIEASLGGVLTDEGDEPVQGLAGPNAPEAAARVLRVDVERIDTLVKLTGELIIAKNALGHTTGLVQAGADIAAIAAALKAQHALLDRLIRELQQSVLSIRVLPLRHVFQRFPRLVREMAAGVGKSVKLVMEGETTEADKAVVEALFDPLLHMLRNAVDHGLELGQTRVAAGKDPVGAIHLRGARNGEHVVIEVEDDGRGIDVGRVRQVAVERGVVSAEAVETLSDEAAAELIFAPGFSTASVVTGLSGRGVGMDAVRSAVARLGGQVTLDNRPGVGTKVRLSLPFTVMMTRLMTVEAGGQVFGIPMDAVIEMVKVSRDRVTPVGAAKVFVLRNRTIPLIDLAQALGEPVAAQGPADANVVVVAVDGQLGGLEVDRLGERIDVMLKPMDGLLAGMPGVAGTTLLGDGRVLIVLDLQALLQ